VSAKRTKKPKSNVRKTRTDWKRLDALTDEEIEAAVRSDPDAPPLVDEEWFKRAHWLMSEPATRVPVLLHLERDVVDWFKQQGGPYQPRIRAVLKAFVQAHHR